MTFAQFYAIILGRSKSHLSHKFTIHSHNSHILISTKFNFEKHMLYYERPNDDLSFIKIIILCFPQKPFDWKRTLLPGKKPRTWYAWTNQVLSEIPREKEEKNCLVMNYWMENKMIPLKRINPTGNNSKRGEKKEREVAAKIVSPLNGPLLLKSKILFCCFLICMKLFTTFLCKHGENTKWEREV